MSILLQINTVVNSCSTGRIAEEIGQVAIKNGWKSYIAYGRNTRPSKSELIKIGNDFTNITEQRTKEVEKKLNTRQRKRFDYENPIFVMEKLLFNVEVAFMS